MRADSLHGLIGEWECGSCASLQRVHISLRMMQHLQKNMVKSFWMGSSVLVSRILAMILVVMLNISSFPFSFFSYQSLFAVNPKEKGTKQFKILFSDWWFGLASWIMVWMIGIECRFCLFERSCPMPAVLLLWYWKFGRLHLIASYCSCLGLWYFTACLLLCWWFPSNGLLFYVNEWENCRWF